MKHKCSVNGCPNKGVFFVEGHHRALCKQHRSVAESYRNTRGDAPAWVWTSHDGKKIGKPREWDGRDRDAIERRRMELFLMPETAEEWAEEERRHA